MQANRGRMTVLVRSWQARHKLLPLLTVYVKTFGKERPVLMQFNIL
jgi:hypothetical protein